MIRTADAPPLPPLHPAPVVPTCPGLSAAPATGTAELRVAALTVPRRPRR
ncbi:hypothetical protein [Micromonospora cremea]|nr:hypothetical protein [Micromonospora cremea]